MSSQGFKNLIAYKKAYKVAMEIFEDSKSFPKEEIYYSNGKIRRSTRSVCANFAEGYRKRIYQKHFISKLNDSDRECAETMVHRYFARDCGYLNEKRHKEILEEYLQIGKLLGNMMNNPQKFGSPKLPKPLPTATAN
ncbi:MAG: four helix bundle protein [Bacteroidota bacterium]|nr:four helix bundle protein [Bacteroidota bacterium]